MDVRPPREPFPTPAPGSAPKSFSGPEFEELQFEKPRNNGLRMAAFVGGGLTLTALVVGAIEFSGALHKPSAPAHNANTKVSGPAVAGSEALDTKKLTDQSELLDQARAFAQKKDYAKAEDIYRSIIKTDPGNAEVKRLLASVLFRQDKIDESAKVLNSISADQAEKHD